MVNTGYPPVSSNMVGCWEIPWPSHGCFFLILPGECMVLNEDSWASHVWLPEGPRHHGPTLLWSNTYWSRWYEPLSELSRIGIFFNGSTWIAWPNNRMAILDCWILHGMLPGPSKEVCRWPVNSPTITNQWWLVVLTINYPTIFTSISRCYPLFTIIN